jgi:hypothetical protein
MHESAESREPPATHLRAELAWSRFQLAMLGQLRELVSPANNKTAYIAALQEVALLYARVAQRDE